MYTVHGFAVRIYNWTVAKLDTGLHRNRRAAGSTPGRGPIVTAWIIK